MTAPLAINRVSFTFAPFADGQEDVGVETGCAEMYNSGIMQVVQGLGYCTDGTFVDFSGIQESNEDHSQFEKQINVTNCFQIGKKLGMAYDNFYANQDGAHFSVMIGGDHSVAASSISASRQKYPDLKVIWIDAHADINTPAASPSGNYHGMVLGHLCNLFADPLPEFEWMEDYFKNPLTVKDIAYIGLRDVDDFEVELIQKEKIAVASMRTIDESSVAFQIKQMIALLDPDDNAHFHISFDVDAADPLVAPGTGTMALGGLTYRESMRIVQISRELLGPRFVSMDVVEVNLTTDQREISMHGDDPALKTEYKTVKFGANLVKAALAKSGLGQL